MRKLEHLAKALSVLVAGSSMLVLGAVIAKAAGQGEDAAPRLFVEYDGSRYFLTRQLNNEELHELLTGNTLVFIHPAGEEQELHLENGQTLNGWEAGRDASTGFWQIEGDEVCWTYPSGTHCKPLYESELENLYGQVPGWYDGPLAFIWEPGDSRGLLDRPLRGDAI